MKSIYNLLITIRISNKHTDERIWQSSLRMPRILGTLLLLNAHSANKFQILKTTTNFILYGTRLTRKVYLNNLVVFVFHVTPIRPSSP